MKERREKKESEQDQPAPSCGGEVGERSSHPGQLVETEGKYLRLLWRVKQVICESLNGVRITKTIYVFQTGKQVHHCAWQLGAGP